MQLNQPVSAATCRSDARRVFHSSEADDTAPAKRALGGPCEVPPAGENKGPLKGILMRSQCSVNKR